MDIYKITEPSAKEVPIVISSPHSGTFFPEEVKKSMLAKTLSNPDDTDWFIDKLYSFAPELGIRMISAHYNRWVIDLNRNSKSEPLYNDGRIITDLVPQTNFNGDSLYTSEAPDDSEINRRIVRYYHPYYQKLEEMLQTAKAKFGHVLLFDAHSIRRHVPGVRKEPFPALILGDNDGQSASKAIIDTALSALLDSHYELQHNHPFKGGNITRSFGRPQEGIHALQLEMIKTNYMDDSEKKYDEARATSIQVLLRKMFKKLIELL